MIRTAITTSSRNRNDINEDYVIVCQHLKYHQLVSSVKTKLTLLTNQYKRLTKQSPAGSLCICSPSFAYIISVCIYILPSHKEPFKERRNKKDEKVLLKKKASSEELFVKELADCHKDLIGSLRSVDVVDATLLLVVLHNRQRLLVEGHQTLADRLSVVVCAARRLSARKTALDHRLFRTVKEQHKTGIHLLCRHLLLPALVVAPVARETVHQEVCFVVRTLSGKGLVDSCLQKTHSNLSRNNLAKTDHLSNHSTVLAAAGHLAAEKIAGAEVLEAVLRHDVRTLRAFAAPGTAENKNN